jgi:hypothetical protein
LVGSFVDADELVDDVSDDGEPEVADGLECDDEPGEELVPESVGSANATPGVLATAIPTPSATAKAPTRPMCVALPIVVSPSRFWREDGPVPVNCGLFTLTALCVVMVVISFRAGRRSAAAVCSGRFGDTLRVAVESTMRRREAKIIGHTV